MIRIGSRGSALALWQANHIAGRLREEGHEVRIEIIRTTGDRMANVSFAAVGATLDKGLFTKEIEEALADGRIDLAVHSLKDLPTQFDPRFTLAAIPEREDPRDAFVSVDYGSLAELPAGARIGTGSPRRQAQLLALRPDTRPVNLRGNVDTRLRKLEMGEVAAVVLAAAGLERLSRCEHLRHRFSVEEMCPAPGQGALGIECRADDDATIASLRFLNDTDACFATTAERTALAALGGGCHVPIGVHCWRDGSRYSATGVVAHTTGTRIVRAAAEGSEAEALGRDLAGHLLSQGAAEILMSSAHDG